MRIFNLAILSVLAYATGTALGTELKISHDARSLQPGEVVLVTVESAQPMEDVEGVAFGRRFPFFAEPGNLVWRGLIGIDLRTKPGKYVIQVGCKSGGNALSREYELRVVSKEFPIRRLTVDSKFVNPPKESLDRIARESKRVQSLFEKITPQKLWSGAFIAPVPGPPISAFGKRNIMNGQERSPHSGTDFKGATGTPIKAPNGGRVVLAADLYYSGNTVIIDHGFGLYSYFAHLSRFASKEGDEVTAGDIVGYVGATGRVTGPHLHWTVRLVKTRVDPLSLMAVAQ